MEEIRKQAGNILGCIPDRVPVDLMEILENVNLNVKIANDYEDGKQLRSSQIVALIVWLWEEGLIGEQQWQN